MSFWNLTGNAGTIKSVNFLGTTDNNPLVFSTNGKEAVQIDQSGNVGIGIDKPGVKLHVMGDRIRLESSDGKRTLDLRADGAALDMESQGAPLFLNGTTQPTFLNPNGGNVGIGMRDPKFQLHVNGSVMIDRGILGLYGDMINLGDIMTSRIFVGSGGGHIIGYLNKSGGGFSIDHPLDPANKFLNHGFVESPKMKNIYDGIITLDGNGQAIVEMPDWFEHVNEDFCYQLTGIGGPSLNLYIAEEISNNRFKIAGGIENQKVSWQVTGVRKDPWARKNLLPIEQEKPENERGYYLHPELYNQTEDRNLMRLRHPMPTSQ